MAQVASYITDKKFTMFQNRQATSNLSRLLERVDGLRRYNDNDKSNTFGTRGLPFNDSDLYE